MARSMIVCLMFLVLPATSAMAVSYRMNGPESVAYDTLYKRYIVSALLESRLYQIDEYGVQSLFVNAGKNPYGNCIKDSVLYVSFGNISDRTVKGYSLHTRSEILSVQINEASASSIDGLTTDTSGYLYVVYTQPGNIFRIDLSDLSYSLFVSYGLTTYTQDIVFDAPNNRLLAAAFYANAPIQAVDLSTSLVTNIKTTTIGFFDGISLDRYGNAYAGCYATGEVFFFDKAMTEPPVLVRDGFASVSGLDYNVRDDILAVPDFDGDSVTFIQSYVAIDADKRIGLPPLEITFSGWAEGDVIDWQWDFGDGDSSSAQSPSHAYVSAGLYPVTLQSVTSAGDTLRRVHSHYIAVLADTLSAGTVSASPGQQVEVIVSATNIAPVLSMIVPIEFCGDPEIIFDSFSTAGCRTESMPIAQILDAPDSDCRVTLRFSGSKTSTVGALYPGSGPIAKLYLTIPDGSYWNRAVGIAFNAYETYQPTFVYLEGEFAPATRSGTINIPTCCIKRGNVDGDSIGEINISDLTYLINYMFKAGSTPPCPDETNVNGDLSEDISDLTYLVSYMFKSGPPPPACP